MPKLNKKLQRWAKVQTSAHISRRINFGFNQPNLLYKRRGLSCSDSELMRPEMWALIIGL
jgi:hypothetical protein